MNRTRILSALVMALVGLPAIFWGGWPYNLLVIALLGLAAWELGGMFQAMQFPSERPLMVSGVLGLLLLRLLRPDWLVGGLAFFALLTASRYLHIYEQGQSAAAVRFSVTLSGTLYFVLLGGYLLELRALPDGLWWFLLVFPIIWAADSGAYSIGIRWGRHRLSPRLSPKKSWEGYLGGVLSGMLAAVALASWYHSRGWLDIAIPQALLLGLVISAVAPLGDLTESLFKREAGIKDSGTLIPGHGGAFDRIDSWLWAATLGYWLIQWFS